ncbi:MAG: HAD-IB family hydrolase [Anaerolineae bacterium]|nr:HAD-IB family hydrolase [Anaerolineae bacterium]
MIVASDFDGTLTAGEMWRGVAQYVSEHGRGLRLWLFMLPKLSRRLLTRVGIGDALKLRSAFMEQLPSVTAGFTMDQVRDLAKWVVDNELWPKRRQAVIAELARHQQEGKRVIVISGAYQPILEEFARRINAEAIGTPLEVVDGKLSGRLSGALNVGNAKADRLRDALNGDVLELAYGDTQNDIPMLIMGNSAVAVNPDSGLRALATVKGWRIIEDAGK